MRRLNVKLLVVVVVSTIVFCVGIFFLHGYQIRRNADVLKEIAEEHKEKGDLHQAVRYLHRYLRYRPDDMDTTCDFALWFAELAELPDAKPDDRRNIPYVLEQALRGSPDRQDIRRRLAEHLMKHGRVKDAMDHLKILLEASPEDAELKYLMASCHNASGEYQPAAEMLREAIKADPQNLPAYRELADILARRLDDPQGADEVMDQLATANPDNYEVYLTRYDYRIRMRLESRDAAKIEIARARDLAPDNPQVLLKAVEYATADGLFEQAREDLDRGLELHPDNVQMYIALASLELTEGRHTSTDRTEQALEALQRGLEQMPDNPLLLVHLTEVQTMRRQFDAARSTIDKLARLNFDEDQIDFLTARVLIGEENWVEAAGLLQKVRKGQGQEKRTLVEIDLMLARCYAATGQNDLQVVAYQRALRVDPLSAQARLGLARALAARGEYAEAENELQRLGAAPGGGSVIEPEMLRLRVSEQFRMPAEERDWSEVDNIIARLDEKDPDNLEVGMLKSRVLVAKGQVDEARALMTHLREKHPNSPRPWAELAEIEREENGMEAAMAVLQEAAETLGNPVQVQLARITLIMRLPRDEAVPALKAEAEKAAERTDIDRALVERVVGEGLYRLGEYAEAQRYLKKVASEQQDDLPLRLVIFSVARDAEDFDGMQSALDEIERLVGKNHSYWQYCRAAQLVVEHERAREAGKRQPEMLDEARSLVQSALSTRPGWSAAVRLDAEIDDLSGRWDDAIEKYQRALELGERQMSPARRLVALLYLRGRFAEAEQVLNTLPAELRSGDMMGRLATDLQFQLGEADSALSIAGEVYDEESTDYLDHLWYGRVLDRAGQAAEAEAAFRLAVKHGPQEGAAWVTLIRQLVRNGKTAEARTLLEEAREALPEQKRALAMAQCYEALGDNEQAEEQYVAAMEANPDDDSIVRSLATFYVGIRRHDKAGVLLEQLIERGGSEGEQLATLFWARRTMAQLLGATGSYKDHRRAIELLDANKIEGKLTLGDRAVKARLLAIRGDLRSRKEAISMLEDILRDDPNRVEDTYLLAQLYDKLGNWGRARQQMLNLLTLAPDEPKYIPAYANMLLWHDEVDEAARMFDRLRQIDERAPITLAVESLVLAKRGFIDEAIAATRRLVTRPLAPQQVGQLKAAGEQFERLIEIGVSEEEPFLDAAEEVYREYVQERPDEKLVLASFLGRRRDLDQGLALCEEMVETQPISAASTAMRIVRERRKDVNVAQLERVDKMFDQALEANPNTVAVLLELAEFRDLQGNYEGAIETYRRVIDHAEASNAQRAAAQNNLAYIYAMRNNGSDALPLVEQAISYFGPMSEVLDTRGMAHAAQGDYESAIRDLREAVEGDPSGLKYFHLAWAHYGAQDYRAAAEALAEARNNGFTEDQVSPLEQNMLNKLINDKQLSSAAIR